MRIWSKSPAGSLILDRWNESKSREIIKPKVGRGIEEMSSVVIIVCDERIARWSKPEKIAAFVWLLNGFNILKEIQTKGKHVSSTATCPLCVCVCVRACASDEFVSCFISQICPLIKLTFAVGTQGESVVVLADKIWNIVYFTFWKPFFHCEKKSGDERSSVSEKPLSTWKKTWPSSNHLIKIFFLSTRHWTKKFLPAEVVKNFPAVAPSVLSWMNNFLAYPITLTRPCLQSKRRLEKKQRKETWIFWIQNTTLHKHAHLNKAGKKYHRHLVRGEHEWVAQDTQHWLVNRILCVCGANKMVCNDSGESSSHKTFTPALWVGKKAKNTQRWSKWLLITDSAIHAQFCQNWWKENGQKTKKPISTHISDKVAHQSNIQSVAGGRWRVNLFSTGSYSKSTNKHTHKHTYPKSNQRLN